MDITIISKVWKRGFLLAGIILLAIQSGGLCQSFMSKTGHVEFDSSVPLHTFTGKSDYLVGKISLPDSTVDFYVDLHTLKTGIEKRDEDMLETLETEKYSFAEFFGQLTSSFDPGSTAPQNVTVEGDFSIHGVSNKVYIEGILQKKGEKLKVTASWTLNMKDYNIEPPGILFYRVSEKIKISISAILSPQ